MVWFILHAEIRVRRSQEPIQSAEAGIDFIDAQWLWNDPDLLEIPARLRGEPRYLVIGRIAGKCWSGVITYRQEHIRIISVRRSRTEEVDLYENSGN
jgi:uncharacterized DUF497 family protein